MIIPQEYKWIFWEKSDNPLYKAFKNKSCIDPRFLLFETEIKDFNTQNIINSSFDESKFNAIYIHIPFCKTRCTYCRFFTEFNNENILNSYVESLVKEIINQPVIKIRKKIINAVYLWWWTPTVLEEKHITAIFDAIKKTHILSNDCEITFESNISLLNENKISALKNAWINRFSFWIQSFNTKVRKFVWRLSEKELLINMIKDIRKRNFANISIDLIYWLPFQDIEILKEDINIWAWLWIEWFDIYQLDSSLLEKKFWDKLEFLTVSKRIEMFEMANQSLFELWYKNINNTHYSNTSRERNLYTELTRAWSEIMRTDTIWYWAWAQWRIWVFKYSINPDVNLYVNAIKWSKSPIVKYLKINEEKKILYDLIWQMDFGIINCWWFKTLYNEDLFIKFWYLFDKWEENGLIVYSENNTIRLTLAWRFWKTNCIHWLIIWDNILNNK